MDTFLWWIGTIAKTLVILGILALVGAMAKSLYDFVDDRLYKRRRDRINLERSALSAEWDLVRPDEHGRLGAIVRRDAVIDLDSKGILAIRDTMETALIPVLEELHAQHKLLQAMAHATPPQTYHNEYIVGDQTTGVERLEEGEEGEWEPTWATYPISRLLPPRGASLGALVVGARPIPEGLDVVTRSLHELMHVLAVGATGWGKSTWLRAFLYQVARAPEPVEVCAIDTSGSALNAIRGWGKLRYPLARTVADACAVLAQVQAEIEERRRLYEEVPHVENLQEYNRATGQNMPPWIVLCDEGTHLLHHKGMGEPLREVVQTARQYGIYQILAGQTAHSKVIETEIRDMYSSRLCFHTSPPSSRTVLDDRGASSLRVKGRMICQFVGTELMELQGPWVSKDEFMGALSNGGARYEMPVEVRTEGDGRQTTEDDERTARIVELAALGWSKRKIEMEVYKYNGGAATRGVNEALERAGEGSPSDVDFCDFCGRDGDSTPEGVTFEACASCGVAVCSDCAEDGRCPDCAEGE